MQTSKGQSVAHLSIEYSENLHGQLDMAEFCEVARGAMINTGAFPLAGIRVRAFCADYAAIGDGNPELAFADMILRMGQGRDAPERAMVRDTIYNALANWCEARVSSPFALSLEVQEISAEFSQKRMNTIRPALVAKGANNV
jgi:5-carboxymethyl-2-hydroxymuconate isomerase